MKRDTQARAWSGRPPRVLFRSLARGKIKAFPYKGMATKPAHCDGWRSICVESKSVLRKLHSLHDL